MPDSRSRDRDDDARDLGRGPGDSRQSNTDKYGHDPRDEARWLDRERDHDREGYDGHPDRDQHEIEEWAREHDLPYSISRSIFPMRASNTRTPTGAGTTWTSRW